MDYDPQNVFAKILRGDLPCHKVYENAHVLAFMDINPFTKGHLLVIPKAPSRNLLDVRDDDLCHVIKAVRMVSVACTKALGCDGVSIRQSNEPAGGQDVFHTHFHVIPRYQGEAMKLPAGEPVDHAQLAALAKRIAAAL